MTRCLPVPRRILLLLALVVGGCGGSATSPPSPPPAPVEAPAPRVLRWTPEEHGEAAARRDWAREETWRADLEAVLAGRDPGGEAFREKLVALADPVLRRGVLREVLERWGETREAVLVPILRGHPADLGEILGERLALSPRETLGWIDRLLFLGPERIREAWEAPGLRLTLTGLCLRSDDPEQDLATGSQRAFALRVAARARLEEAVEAFKLAAGLARGDRGERLVPDPYEPAALLARGVIEENRARRRKALAERERRRREERARAARRFERELSRTRGRRRLSRGSRSLSREGSSGGSQLQRMGSTKRRRR